MNGVIYLILFLTLCIAGSCNHTMKVPKNGEDYVLPKCEPIVEYSARTFSIKGIDIPISNVPVKIGDVTWDAKLLQQAHVTTQILDMHRMDTCQKLPTYASIGKEELKKALEDMREDEARLTQLALIVASGNQEGVKKWVEAYSPRAYAVATPEVISKVSKLSPTMEPQSIEAQVKAIKANRNKLPTADIVVPFKSLMK